MCAESKLFAIQSDSLLTKLLQCLHNIILINNMEPESTLTDINVDERAYRFFPTREEEKHGFGKPNGTRVVFHGQVEHDDFEKKKLGEFLDYLKTKHNNQYDQKYFNHHMLVLFLYSNEYKNDKTYDSMKHHMQFVSKYVRNPQGEYIIQYHKDEKVKKLIDSGFFYICGRDIHFRPTIVFNLKKADLKDPESVLRAVVLVQEQAIEKMMIPGQVESWNIIYDLGGMGLTDLPVNALKSTLQVISANYSGRLFKLWMVNSPTTVYLSWKVAKNFLDPITVDKIVIVKKNTDESMWKLYDKGQIEKKYGGTQPDRTAFYPFKIPKAVVDESRLVSDQKYQQFLETGFLKNNTINPKYLKPKLMSQQPVQEEQKEIRQVPVEQVPEQVQPAADIKKEQESKQPTPAQTEPTTQKQQGGSSQQKTTKEPKLAQKSTAPEESGTESVPAQVKAQ